MSKIGVNMKAMLPRRRCRCVAGDDGRVCVAGEVAVGVTGIKE